MSTLRRSPLLFAAIALVLPLVSAPATAAPPGVPRLGLRAAAASVEVFRYGREPASLELLGVSLVAREAPFELRVRRETYDDPVRVYQAIHGPGAVHLTELPADILEGWFGLDRFLVFELFDRDGVLIRRKATDACLAGWQVERVDDSGPFDPTYPQGCGSNPLTLGAVWGVDQGWAVAPLLSNAGDSRPRRPVRGEGLDRSSLPGAVRHRARGRRGPDRGPDPVGIRLPSSAVGRLRRRTRRNAAR